MRHAATAGASAALRATSQTRAPLSAIPELLKELGAPAITVIGFALVLFKLNASKKDMAVLDAKFTVGMAELKADVRSIKGNHLPHIEAAIKELAKGTPNEEHVKAILDLSREVELRASDGEQ